MVRLWLQMLYSDSKCPQALLGVQLVITLVMISVIQKLGPHFSFARWLLCSTGLIRYLYPTDSELRQLANVPKSKKAKLQENGRYKSDIFHIPKSLDVQLETAKVSKLDVIHLRYYIEYRWLIDFVLYSGIVYSLTEVYQFYFPSNNEVNLSMMWCCLVIGFAIKVLLSLTVQYFKGEESIGERSVCIVMGLTYLVISMVVLIVDENTLELGLDSAYDSFNDGASAFLTGQGLNSSGPASKIVLKFSLAVWCGILGAIFTFPGIRIAKMHWDLLKYFKNRKSISLLFNLNFALPFLLVILWIKPVCREYLTVRVFSGMKEPLLSDDGFETLRISLVVFTMLLKFLLAPWYLQAYLDMAHHRTEQQKKEAGRITNVDFQKKISAVFYYLCVATLQYLIPVIVCLYFALMNKTLGSYSWVGKNLSVEECPAIQSSAGVQIDPFNIKDGSDEAIVKSVAGFHLALDSFKSIFTAAVYRGLFGFATWWSCFLYFTSTSVGLIYQSYFTTV